MEEAYREFCKQNCKKEYMIIDFAEKLPEYEGEKKTELLNNAEAGCQKCRVPKFYSWLEKNNLLGNGSDEFKEGGTHGPDKPF